jgi:predicted SAM-dependent methyltransferase
MITKLKKSLFKCRFIKSLYFFILKRERKLYRNNISLFKDKNGIEIGGPTVTFSKGNPLPVYNVVKSLDNVNFSSDNFWSKIEEGDNFIFDENKLPGRQFIADAVQLSRIEDEQYEFVLSSHVLEHVANPIRALIEWRRVLKIGGALLIIVPDRRYTYDRNRPLTTFDHILEDYLNKVQEDDSTHLEEIVKLHDLSKDSTVDSFESHRERTLNNKNTRIAHHHTFDMQLIRDLTSYCGFKCLQQQEFRPYHLALLAVKV